MSSGPLSVLTGVLWSAGQTRLMSADVNRHVTSTPGSAGSRWVLRVDVGGDEVSC